MSKNWIRKAVKHKGSLKEFAKKHKALLKNGNINLAKLKRLKGLTEHRIRQINATETLKKLRRKKK